MTRTELDPWVESYLSYLADVRRMNARTIIDIRCTLKKIGEYLEAAKPEAPLWSLSLDDYLRWLNVQRESTRSEHALAKELSHMRGLLDYAWRSGRTDRNVLDGFRMQKPPRQIEARSLTLEEAKRLVAACPRSTSQERRNRLILLVLYGCGLRTAELCGLDVGDVNVERQEVFVRKGKNDCQRTVPVPGAVWMELLAYLTERRGKRGPLFRTFVKRRRISAKDVGAAVKQATELAGIEGHVTAKTLRHTFATHLMDRGVSLAIISSLMGHRSPSETGVYLHVLPGKGEAAVASLQGENWGEQ
tara:strand:+ start:1211 stop:2119 length:909 start_codon:yes stop_codon:yes gene_type:complete